MDIESIHDGNRIDTKKCCCRRSVNEPLRCIKLHLLARVELFHFHFQLLKKNKKKVL